MQSSRTPVYSRNKRRRLRDEKRADRLREELYPLHRRYLREYRIDPWIHAGSPGLRMNKPFTKLNGTRSPFERIEATRRRAETASRKFIPRAIAP